MYFFEAAVRPILEYACPAKHTSLTKEWSESLEYIQHHALQVTVGNKHAMFNSSTLAKWHLSLCSTLFRQRASGSHVLHYLLPAKRDTKIACQLQSTTKHPTVHVKTNSFIPHATSVSNTTCRFDCVHVYCIVSYIPSVL